ncbi:hypothetical protein SARC_01694 [Sphaeroforma arctica JP610]|uniref:DUF1499 domain-containing protein n=1 Tax=Sphaeroforma arctica JP610 TaxID=667725 RepID=A0A0L0GD53_9EUKA|nr:hypothetical protein SARC_01694 [Sphaeroforma arctica JP610]KNC86168.1 hypothetical protein SARC_01694 [Sphaeroforma arctica JP610]|eukprot:XP_014160070.1 hypothetical protein SARC_01694 [Sphaeroforma arctica JP610]
MVGKMPTDIGVHEGNTLKAVPKTPNCVSSMCPAADKQHFIEPIAFTQETTVDALAHLASVIGQKGHLVAKTATKSYQHYTYTTYIMKFVDDVEFLADAEAKVLHVRAASRVGRSDFGVNRKRVEAIRKAFSAPTKTKTTTKDTKEAVKETSAATEDSKVKKSTETTETVADTTEPTVKAETPVLNEATKQPEAETEEAIPGAIAA